MFAVVRTGGKQYRVALGDKIVVEKLDGSAGDRITLGEVLLAGDGGELRSTDGLTVAAEIIAQAKADKVTVFKKRRRHNYRRKKGHRQQHTILRIVAIGDQQAEKPAKKAAQPKAEAAPAAASPAPETAAKPKRAAAPKAQASADAPTGTPVAEGEPTANPAPDNADQAGAEPPAKKASAKKTPASAEKKAAAPSTKNAAPAKGAAKKTPKAK